MQNKAFKNGTMHLDTNCTVQEFNLQADRFPLLDILNCNFGSSTLMAYSLTAP